MLEEEEMIEETEYKPESMGGKRKSKRRVNPALGKWVAFVKKVQKEEKISYKEAMTRAKARKDKGEKWMGGANPLPYDYGTLKGGQEGEEMEEDVVMEEDMDMEGGRRRRKHRRKTHKRRGSKKRRHTRRQRGGGSNLLRKFR